MGERLRAGDRQGAQLDGEEPDQHQPQPEAWRRLADGSEGEGGTVCHLVLAHRGDDAERDRQDQCDDNGENAERCCRGKAFREEADERLAEIDAVAEIAARRIGDPCAVLDEDRPVEAVAGADDGNVVFRGAFAGNCDGGIAGDEHQAEADAGDDQGDERGYRQSLEGEAEHAGPLRESCAAAARAHGYQRKVKGSVARSARRTASCSAGSLAGSSGPPPKK